MVRKNDIKQLETTNEILQEALRIKKLLGIDGDKYHAKGVGESDLFIIATARVNKAGLVSDEKRQNALLKEPTKRKIPAVCAMKEVNVLCINFLEFIKRSDEVFR